jgi:hypothetical protein
MENLLSLTWYVESPLDSEYKEYILFSYLQKVDLDFYNKNLSPHLLHLERLIDELISFESSFNIIKTSFDKNRYLYFDNVKLEGEKNEILYEIKDLISFSIPQIEPRIDLGYKILKKYNQILY